MRALNGMQVCSWLQRTWISDNYVVLFITLITLQAFMHRFMLIPRCFGISNSVDWMLNSYFSNLFTYTNTVHCLSQNWNILTTHIYYNLS